MVDITNENGVPVEQVVEEKLLTPEKLVELCSSNEDVSDLPDALQVIIKGFRESVSEEIKLDEDRAERAKRYIDTHPGANRQVPPVRTAREIAQDEVLSGLFDKDDIVRSGITLQDKAENDLSPEQFGLLIFFITESTKYHLQDEEVAALQSTVKESRAYTGKLGVANYVPFEDDEIQEIKNNKRMKLKKTVIDAIKKQDLMSKLSPDKQRLAVLYGAMDFWNE